MERFTTNSKRYFNEMKNELQQNLHPENFEWIFNFCQIGQLLDHAFSLRYYIGTKDKLVTRTWDAELDGKRFAHGIYNLDRLAVTEETRVVPFLKSHVIDGLFKPEKFSVTNTKMIILDGLYCELQFQNNTLNWNTDDQMSDELKTFICHLRNEVNEHYNFK